MARPPQALAWVDARPADPRAPQLSLFDRGFTLADGLFETLRAHGGTLFRPRPHLDRLRAGAAALGIPMPKGLETLLSTAMRDAAAAGLGNAAVRITLSRGPGPQGIAEPAEVRPTVTVTVQPLPVFPRALYEHGIILAIASGRRNERAMTAGLKVLGYADAVMAIREARARGADDALFLDTEEHVSEGSASNVFLVVGGMLVTPPVSCGALPGITRAAVLECARALPLACAERVLERHELESATETFLTSSLRGIAPAVRVVGEDRDGRHARTIGAGVPGPITRQLMQAYARLVRRECTVRPRRARAPSRRDAQRLGTGGAGDGEP